MMLRNSFSTRLHKQPCHSSVAKPVSVMFSSCTGLPLSRPSVCAKASGEHRAAVDLQAVSDLIAAQPLDAERRFTLERLAVVLDVPMGTVKSMVFKRKALADLAPDEVNSRINLLAQILDVTRDEARQMAVIQPGLLFDTEKQAETLKFGISSICYELGAPKQEVVDLIIKNQSVLHGRELHLSVADMAHLAMLREPKGRIVD